MKEIKGDLKKLLIDAAEIKGRVTHMTVKSDIEAVKGELSSKISTVSGDLTNKITGVSGELTTKITGVSGDLSTKMAASTGDISSKVENLSGQMKGTLTFWQFIVIAGALLAIVLRWPELFRIVHPG
ncbi:hypothetical protein DEM27_05665 [Metarhizobium album]|uniref:Uncharacterized protein n=2 Tax=Metarhizobium album TaxID=2182425 RepID=A0A2U2DVA2_9HYPH|nr:hypothetical protein DEM27_05665 [Rhizobium album]